MLYPIMNRSRSLIDLGGIWHFQLGDETEPEDTWSAPQEMELDVYKRQRTDRDGSMVFPEI